MDANRNTSAARCRHCRRTGIDPYTKPHYTRGLHGPWNERPCPSCDGAGEVSLEEGGIAPPCPPGRAAAPE